MLTSLALLLASIQSGESFVPEPLAKVVVYEVNLRAFGPRPGLAAVTARLGKIRALGVNVLWLMPIQPVGRLRSAGGLGSPYSVQDFTAVSPEFGDAQALGGLVQAAHRLKMAVILDWVADHTSWDHPWIARHPDWYLHDRQGNLEPPPGTGWNDVAALDYHCEPMRREMIDSMRFWLARYDLDGFRCDSADRMPFDFWRRAIDTLRASTTKRLLMLAEGHRADDYAAGFDLTYGWNLSIRLREIFGGKSATALAPASVDDAKELVPTQRRLNFITNHDYAAWEGSLIDFYKTAQGARTAFAVLALYGGDPLIYTGQEVDFEKRIPIFDHSSIDWSRNPETSSWMARLLALRDRHPALLTGAVTNCSTDNIVMFGRREGSDDAFVLANVRDRAASAPVGAAYQGDWTDGFTGRPVRLGPEFSLPPFGCSVLLRRT